MLQVKTFSFNEKKAPKDPERREQAHRRALDPERSNFWVKTFSFNEEDASEGPGRREKTRKLCLNLKDKTFK